MIQRYLPVSSLLASSLLVAAACGGGDDGPGADAAPAIDAAAVPMIGDALAEMCGAYTPAPGIGAGDDLHKVTLTDPDAVCNDGTPAVMYIRPSTGGNASDQWVFYLQGGHNCGGFGECVVRYCGTQKYTKAKMSSRWTPMVANTDQQGLFDRDGVNPFGNANAVLLYYCSSDHWLGTRSDTVLTNPEDASQQYRLHFRGHTIVEAALDQLLAGPVTSDDGQASLPSLAAATQVLWTGASAGAAGAEHQADYVRERLGANGTVVRAAFDANFPPRSVDLDPAIAAATDGMLRDLRWPTTYVSYWGAWVDQTCQAAHPGADAWLCGDQNHVVMNHITTPFIARQDLTDRVIGERYLNAGATQDQLATWWQPGLSALRNIQSTAEETITFRPGVYGPNCGQHVALTSKDFFQVATVETPAADLLTWRGAILAWLTAPPDTTIEAIDSVSAMLSTCPANVDTGE